MMKRGTDVDKSLVGPQFWRPRALIGVPTKGLYCPRGVYQLPWTPSWLQFVRGKYRLEEPRAKGPRDSVC